MKEMTITTEITITENEFEFTPKTADEMRRITLTAAIVERLPKAFELIEKSAKEGKFWQRFELSCCSCKSEVFYGIAHSLEDREIYYDILREYFESLGYKVKRPEWNVFSVNW